MSDIKLDLDALAPKPSQVKISGKWVKLPPPTVRQLFQGVEVIDKIDRATTMEEVTQAYDETVAYFKEMIPSITEELSIVQYKELQMTLQTAANPPDTKALEEAGISIVGDDDGKKEEPSTPEK